MPRLKLLLEILLTALTLCALCAAQDLNKQLFTGERHTTSDPGSALYLRSAFAHGFIHGYEQGFHLADLDYHVGRTGRKLDDLHQYRDAAGFRAVFGDKKTFQHGYREGFLQGYDDSIHSRHFRAEVAGQVVADGLKDFAGSSQELDAGFAAGFAAQRSNPENALACREPESAVYCNGFTLGAEFAAISSGAAWPFLAKEKLDAVAVK
jgi:hypothetical protein